MSDKEKELEDMYSTYMADMCKMKSKEKSYKIVDNNENEQYWREVTVKASIEAMKTIFGNVVFYKSFPDVDSMVNASVNLGIKLTNKLRELY